MSNSACDHFEVISADAVHTHHIGRALGRCVQPGDIICLSGMLGAGKTALTQGIGAAWGVQEAVTSPTFTLIHEHRRSYDHAVLYHVDCYRLSGSRDGWSIGLDDMLHDQGVVIIEWPEHIADSLPAEHLRIVLTILDDTRRRLVISATGERYQQLCAHFRAQLALP